MGSVPDCTKVCHADNAAPLFEDPEGDKVGKRVFKKPFDFGGRHHSLKSKIEKFQSLLRENNHVLDLIAEANEMLSGDFLFDMQYPRQLAAKLESSVKNVIVDLNYIADNRYLELLRSFDKTKSVIDSIIESRHYIPRTPLLLPLDKIDRDARDAVGGKMMHLGELKVRLRIRIPDGFAIPVRACRMFFKKSNIDDRIDTVAAALDAGEIDAKEAEKILLPLVREAPLPRQVLGAIRQAVSLIGKKRGGKIIYAVRSSAIGEDGALSFAGLHDSVLGVLPGKVPQAYKQVVAGLFNSRAILYRRIHKEPIQSALMAVGIQEMVRATAGGVVYTVDPNRPDEDAMIITAAPGLGKMIVDGGGNTDQFTVSREPPYNVISRKLAAKQEMYQTALGGGIQLVGVPAEDKNTPVVSEEFLAVLAETALRIEHCMKRAVDIEWCRDENGELVILQARPLKIENAPTDINRIALEASKRHKPLIANRGMVACKGIAYGRVVHVTGEEAPHDLPHAPVLVARNPSPHLAELVPYAAAVVTDVGTTTGHLATIIREFRIPSIMDTAVATKILKDGMDVTVDAEEKTIYEGKVKELLKWQIFRVAEFENTSEYRVLKRMLRNVAPLNLKNPHHRKFLPKYCRTYHDMIRFAHEKSVEALQNDRRLSSSTKNSACRRLNLDIPLDLTVIDMGDGLKSNLKDRRCNIEDITCSPFLSLIEGLTAPGAWSANPAGMDFDSFMSSAMSPTAIPSMTARRPMQNLAIISDNYLNLSLHLGYHFNQVDSFVSETRNDNYIYFRFMGGMTDNSRRSRRARMIAVILKKHDFMVEAKGDFIVARIKKLDRAAMLDRLKMTGYLIGFTRQLDVKMVNDSMIERNVSRFMEEFYKKAEIE